MAIEWAAPERARHVTVAPEPIIAEREADGSWTAETQVFRDNLPWIGLLADDLAGDAGAPVIVLPSGRREPMLKIALPGQAAFWVEHGPWDAEGHRHLSALHRESGQVIIEAAGRTIVLHHTMGGAGRLDEYLADFRSEFIWLALNAGSKASGAVAAGGGLNLALTETLAAFAAVARVVVDRPATQLREVVEPCPVDRIRPTAATFRHYAQNPAARSLPGRKAVETLDTPENRYLHHMIGDALRLAYVASRAFVGTAERLHASAAEEDGRAKTLASTRWRDVDPEILDSQFAQRARLVEELKAYSAAKCPPNAAEYGVTLTKRYRGGGFFYESINGRARKAEGTTFAVAAWEARLDRLIADIQPFNRDFAFVAEAAARRRTTGKDKPFHHLEFTCVYAVRMRTDVIGNQARYRSRLDADGWRVPISATERRELANEAKTATMRVAALNSRAQQVREAAEMLDDALRVLQTLDQKLIVGGVRRSPVIPLGQRYLQSPRYAAALAAFRAIEAALARSGIGFDTLDRLETVGVLHASALYERWCLVKIIAVLVEDYVFEPPSDWEACLVRAILDRTGASVLELRRTDLGLAACIQYQPTLRNGRRPDFAVSFRRLEDAAPAWQKGIVLDAKFRTRWKRGEVPRIVETLLREKGYDSNGDRVFVLHPVADSVSAPTSPLAWGRHCDYGHDKARHRHGSILLASGIHGPESRLNLKRLIAMEIQSLMQVPGEDDDDAERDDLARRLLCIKCGAQHGAGDLREAKMRSGWDLECRSCKSITWRTHCYNCAYPLFKNGVQMTYHGTLAAQITNIACPSCGFHFGTHGGDGTSASS